MPDCHEISACLEQGARLLEQERFDLAVACFRQAVQLAPQLARAHAQLAIALLALQRFQEAADSLQQALRDRPDPEILSQLSYAFGRLNRWTDARACCHFALQMSPRFAWSHTRLGQAYLKQGMFAEAAECFRASLQLQPDDASVLLQLGDALQEQDQFADALQAYGRYLALDPSSLTGHLRQARTLLAMDRSAEAEIAIQRGLGIESTPMHEFNLLSHSLIAMGHTDVALRLARRWLELHPNEPRARHLLRALGGEADAGRASDEYVASAFDGFAATFDSQMGKLDYRGPQLVAQLLDAIYGPASSSLAILDAGCGTGLCGPVLRPYARTLEGIDLSAEMLLRAQRREVYDRLQQAELTQFLHRHPATYDLVVCADTLVYFGDLSSVLQAAATSLNRTGHFVFTLEHAEATEPPWGYAIQPSGRYRHSRRYVEDTVRQSLLDMRSVTQSVLRTELLAPVHGLAVVASKTIGRA